MPRIARASSVARLSAILRMVFARSATRSFATRPRGCSVMALSSTLNFAPQPPFFLKQTHPPPYSSLPLMIAATLHVGQTRTLVRQRYLSSHELHEPEPDPTQMRSPVVGCSRYRFIFRW